MRIQRWFFVGLSLAIGGLASGCGSEDEIREYRVPHVDNEVKTRKVEAVRLLAGIFPVEDKIWFLMVKGPESAVSQNKDAFDGFIRSVKLGPEPPTWTLPEDWRQEKGNNLRYATIVIDKPQKLELVVTPLGKEAGDLLGNINRWRGQIGLAPIDKGDTEELARVAQAVEIHGVKATLVDMVGHVPGGKKKRAAAPAPAVAADLKAPTKFEPPKDWVKDSKPSGPAFFSWSVSEGNELATVTITALPGDGGGWPANLKRWREQVGLAPADSQGSEKEITIDGVPGHYVDLANPKLPGGRNRILGVMLVHGNVAWFFKMTGPVDLVGRQKAAFEAFLQTVRFESIKRSDS